MSETGYANINGAQVNHWCCFTRVSRMWDGQFDEFAQRYKVVRYDLRGYGKTEIMRTGVICMNCWSSWASNGRICWDAR